MCFGEKSSRCSKRKEDWPRRKEGMQLESLNGTKQMVQDSLKPNKKGILKKHKKGKIIKS